VPQKILIQDKDKTMKKSIFVLALMLQIAALAKTTRDLPMPDCYPCTPPAAAAR